MNNPTLIERALEAARDSGRRVRVYVNSYMFDGLVEKMVEGEVVLRTPGGSAASGIERHAVSIYAIHAVGWTSFDG